ncbi:MAG: hypothetical protein U1E58_10150 [Tabrizicola sp.]
MKSDLYSGFAAVTAIAPAVQAAAVQGASVDVSQAVGVTFVINTGAIAGAGDFGVAVEESLDGITWGAVPAARLKRPNVPATLAQNATYKIGYYGKLKFARVNLTKAGGTSIAAGAIAVLRPQDRPAA